MIALLIFPPLVLGWWLFSLEVRTAYRGRARLEVAFSALDRVSAQFRRMGIEMEFVAGQTKR